MTSTHQSYDPLPMEPPGELIREELESRGWGQEDLARITGRPLKTINAWVKGTKQITPDTALQLASAFGTSPQLWLNLEAAYRLSLITRSVDEAVQRRARMYSLAPIRDMQKRGWLPTTDDLDTLRDALCRFFSLADIGDEPALGASLRATDAPTVEAHSIRAWVFGARNLAADIDADAFDRERLDSMIAELLTLVPNPSRLTEAPDLLAAHGIRLVLLTHLPKTRVDGAMLYLDEARMQPVLALSVRINTYDSFWFTLCHELAHLYLGHEPTVDSDARDGAKHDRDEDDANRRAADWLIPPNDYQRFVTEHPRPSRAHLIEFAAQIGTHPAIVAGRMKRDGHLLWSAHRGLHVPIRDVLQPQ